MRVGVVKPDWRIVGGFERVLRTLVAGLRDRGHEVVGWSVDLKSLPRVVDGVAVDDAAWARFPELFGHLAAIEAFRRLDLSGCDVVLTTQPPSYAVPHDRKVALFYHHARIFYDLAPVYRAGGYLDPDLHDAAIEAVRRRDEPLLREVSCFLVPSRTVASRLDRFSGITDGIAPFHAPPTVRPAGVTGPGTDVLCVSRHEFPKRTELFVAAMKLLPQCRGVCIGAGGRSAWVRHLDARLTADPGSAARCSDEELWLRRAEGESQYREEPEGARASNVRFIDRVGDDELGRRFDAARCVVAPALEEDYGLTALEAMAHGRAVVVCTDGGGLAELVDDSCAGLVADPTPPAVAEAVERLHDDAELARRLGARGRAWVQDVTWERALDQVERALHGVADGAMTGGRSGATT